MPWSERLPDSLSREFPSDGQQAWLVRDACVVQDGLGRYWFAAQQGVGHFMPMDNGNSPVPKVSSNEFTCGCGRMMVRFGLEPATESSALTGSHGETYRRGQRWLADDAVRAIAVDQKGAWIATAAGLSHIHFVPMTLKEKRSTTKRSTNIIDAPSLASYVIEAHTDKPGDKSVTHRSDSDNDGLWTAMYGAGECYAYAATKDPAARQRAKDAFEACANSPPTRRFTPPPRDSSHELSSPSMSPIPTNAQATRSRDKNKLASEAIACGASMSRVGRHQPTASTTGKVTPVPTNSMATISSMRCTTI
ncbi:MAG: hypothetical protein R3C56_25095 [Pirellulaceae bacterium]